MSETNYNDFDYLLLDGCSMVEVEDLLTKFRLIREINKITSFPYVGTLEEIKKNYFLLLSMGAEYIQINSTIDNAFCHGISYSSRYDLLEFMENICKHVSNMKPEQFFDKDMMLFFIKALRQRIDEMEELQRIRDCEALEKAKDELERLQKKINTMQGGK